jgi:type IV pilus assembly protein PilA
VRPCPYCAKAIEDHVQVCPFCNSNLTMPAAWQNFQSTPLPGRTETSGKAIASLVCGILFFFLPSAIVAVIMGHLSLSEIKRGAGRLSGRGMAIVGLVLGYLGLSVIPILIIAAIAIPNLLRARIAANEASAVGSLRSYQYALGEYAAKCPQIGFPHSLGSLGPGRGDCKGADLLDHSLGTDKPTKSGYVFSYRPGPEQSRGQVVSFTLEANPLVQGTSGMRYFFLDQTGIIHMSSDGPADGDSPVLE